jgi:general stress protein 26
MPTPQELEAKLWSALKSDRTVMMGLAGVQEGHTRPMTAMAEHDRGQIWFFTSIDNAIAQNVSRQNRAIVTFASKGHDVFAAIHGTLTLDNDRAAIDRLWNRFIAAWYEQGKDDPKLVLLRLDPESAEIWENGSSIVAGIKMMFGSDPKQDYKDKVAKVSMHAAR